MTKKTTIQRLAQVLMVILVIQSSTCLAADNSAEKIATVLMNAAKKIGLKGLPRNWAESPNVKDVTTFEVNKRAAILKKVLDYYQDNEKKVFPNIKTNGDQLAMSIITRIFFLSHLSTLITSTEDNDVVIKDYFSEDIADLKLVLNGKKNNINYGNYLKWREMRGKILEDKFFRIFYTDKKFLTEYIGLIKKEKDGNKAQALTSEIFIVSLAEACVDNEIYEKICVNL